MGKTYSAIDLDKPSDRVPPRGKPVLLPPHNNLAPTRASPGGGRLPRRPCPGSRRRFDNDARSSSSSENGNSGSLCDTNAANGSSSSGGRGHHGSGAVRVARDQSRGVRPRRKRRRRFGPDPGSLTTHCCCACCGCRSSSCVEVVPRTGRRHGGGSLSRAPSHRKRGFFLLDHDVRTRTPPGVGLGRRSLLPPRLARQPPCEGLQIFDAAEAAGVEGRGEDREDLRRVDVELSGEERGRQSWGGVAVQFGSVRFGGRRKKRESSRAGQFFSRSRSRSVVRTRERRTGRGVKCGERVRRRHSRPSRGRRARSNSCGRKSSESRAGLRAGLRQLFFSLSGFYPPLSG